MSDNQIISPYDFFADENLELQAFVRQELANKNIALSNSAIKFITTTAVIIASKRIPGAGVLNLNDNVVAQVSINGVSRAWGAGQFS